VLDLVGQLLAPLAAEGWYDQADDPLVGLGSNSMSFMQEGSKGFITIRLGSGADKAANCCKGVLSP